MRRGDYELIAKVIKGMHGTKDNGVPIKKFVFYHFVRELEKDNGNFNEDNFRKDCGL